MSVSQNTWKSRCTSITYYILEIRHVCPIYFTFHVWNYGLPLIYSLSATDVWLETKSYTKAPTPLPRSDNSLLGGCLIKSPPLVLKQRYRSA